MTRPPYCPIRIAMLFAVSIIMVGCSPNTSTSENVENAMSDTHQSSTPTNNDLNDVDEPIGTPLAGTEQTIMGEVTHHVVGIMVDANNTIVVRTDAGALITVKVMEAGRVPPHLRDQVCDKNPRANEVFNTLSVGDRVEVFGQISAKDHLEVCSDERFWIKKQE